MIFVFDSTLSAMKKNCVFRFKIVKHPGQGVMIKAKDGCPQWWPLMTSSHVCCDGESTF